MKRFLGISAILALLAAADAAAAVPAHGIVIVPSERGATVWLVGAGGAELLGGVAAGEGARDATWDLVNAGLALGGPAPAPLANKANQTEDAGPKDEQDDVITPTDIGDDPDSAPQVAFLTATGSALTSPEGPYGGGPSAPKP